MRLPRPLAALLLSLLAALPSASSSAPTSSPQTTVRFVVAPSPQQQLANPYHLPSSTAATLTAPSRPLHRAPLGVGNDFVFANVTAGSYLLDVHCATHAFAPLRVDVLRVDDDDEGVDTAVGSRRLRVRAWETFRGNDWDNKGEEARTVSLADGDGEAFELKVWGAKNYFTERSKFSVFSILKNPMILIGLVSMGLFFGLPYLVENMDPEMRAEWEENQKNNPVNSILGTGGASGAGGIGNFDVASFLAGSAKRDDAAASPSSGGGASGGGKKDKKR